MLPVLLTNVKVKINTSREICFLIKQPSWHSSGMTFLSHKTAPKHKLQVANSFCSTPWSRGRRFHCSTLLMLLSDLPVMSQSQNLTWSSKAVSLGGLPINEPIGTIIWFWRQSLSKDKAEHLDSCINPGYCSQHAKPGRRGQGTMVSFQLYKSFVCC